MSLYPSSEMSKVPYHEQFPEQTQPQPYEPPPPYAPETGPSAPVAMAGQTVTVIVDNGKFGPFPKAMKCYHCGQQIMTTTSTKPSWLTYSICSLLCVVGCFCGCCLVPFCIPSNQDVIHKCPNCKQFLGAYERLRFGRRR